MKDRTAYIVFLINLFQSIWNEVVQPVVVRLVSMPLWTNLIDTQRAQIFESRPKLSKTWNAIQKVHENALGTSGGDSAQNLSEKQRKICVPGSFVPIDYERNFLVYLMQDYFARLEAITSSTKDEKVDEHSAKYLERFLELQIDLLNQLPTRRFYRTLFESMHFIVISRASAYAQKPRAKLFCQLLSILHFYERFEIDDFTGDALTDAQMSTLHYSNVQRAQATAFKKFSENLRKFALSNVAAVDTRASLVKYLEPLTDEELYEFCERLMLVWPRGSRKNENLHKELDRERLVDVIVNHLERRTSQLDSINAKSLYPDETLLWDANAVPNSNFTGEAPLALPKLNLQFLTFHDHLLRNFTLFRLESAYEIREDIEDAVKRIQPRLSAVGQTIMKGWARMALPLSHGIQVTHVAKKIVGEAFPEKVFAEIPYFLPARGDTIRGEWDALKVHDIVFVVSIKAKISDTPSTSGHSAQKKNSKNRSAKTSSNADESGADSDKTKKGEKLNFPEEYGIVAVRGAEVVEILDENGKTISDMDIDAAPRTDKSRARSGGVSRTLKVLLDPAQYHHDLYSGENAPKIQKTASILTADEMAPSDTPAMYKTFNVLVRRSSKENNFKAILETIRQLMNSKFVVPRWLSDVFLGYGDPTASTNIEPAKTIDYVDTFLSVDHAKESFPGKDVQIVGEGADSASDAKSGKDNNGKKSSSASKKKGSAAKKSSSAMDEDLKEEEISGENETDLTAQRDLFKASFEDEDVVKIEVYRKYDENSLESSSRMSAGEKTKIKRNPIKFTPTQVEAISSAMNKGLTMVVGPPGTGKTDVAVQIVNNWYHNFKNERTLLVTHSNNALNQIFEKIMVLDVDERHLLRLGHGGGMLETEKDFSKPGRVNYMLQRRIDLLAKVETLAISLDHPPDVAYSVETAKNFFTITVKAKWEKFQHQIAQDIDSSKKSENTIPSRFPFTAYFQSGHSEKIFGAHLSLDDCVVVANRMWDEIVELFSELEECRAFEVLRSSYDRGNYLLTKQAKIVAMTCTHAALKRGELVKLGFKFDNILMEEAAQILEIETFIPMMLQEHVLGDSEPRLKRVVLIGDHNQLPPVVKNMAFQRFSHLDQSLFTRFVRLGVPTITLDSQGRARSTLAALYAWRYANMEKASSNQKKNTTENAKASEKTSKTSKTSEEGKHASQKTGNGEENSEGLKNLSHVLSQKEFQLANAGFAYDYQLIDVPDYQGMGEIEPNPHFIQNLGEAEYVVATYMYMRMLGYPREKISIITSYNGQKHLIRDVIKQRCAWDPRFGNPSKITTVDRFQGQQNDYILFSLVRTKTVGHLRDVRRLVVAMSRARLGLYIFGRKDLFKDCYELTPTFSKLLQRPTQLQLIKGETYGNVSRAADDFGNDKPEISFQVADVVHMGQVVLPSYQSASSSSIDANAMQTGVNDDREDAEKHEDGNDSDSSDDVAAYEDPELENQDDKMDVANEDKKSEE